MRVLNEIEYAIAIQPDDYALIAFLNGGELPEFDNDNAYFCFEIKDGEIINKQVATRDNLMDWTLIDLFNDGDLPGPAKFLRIWRSLTKGWPT
jgi:hypothetical protein